MNRLDLLSDLQEIDIMLDTSAARRKQLTAELSDESRVVSARADFNSATHRDSDLRARLRELELEEEGLEDKLRQVNGRLYGGMVGNPKELSGLEQDARMLDRNKNGIEDRMLELMTELDNSEKEENAARMTLERAIADQNELATRNDALLKELEQVEEHEIQKRDALRAQLSPSDIQVYEGLRRRKKGRALANIKGAACSVCGYDVPSGLASRARIGEELVFCPNCERILVP